MTVIRPGFGANGFSPGPEIYAPPDRRTPEQADNSDRVAFARPQTDEPSQYRGQSTGNLDSLIRRIAGASIDEIDNVIRELENLRNMLRSEGERVAREVAGYAALSHTQVNAMRALSESIQKWKTRAS
jgi:hypothetical protein